MEKKKLVIQFNSIQFNEMIELKVRDKTRKEKTKREFEKGVD